MRRSLSIFSPPRASSAILAVLLCAVMVAAVPAAAQGSGLLKVYYPDIEQGSATLLIGPTGKGVLVDSGSEIRGADDDVVLFVTDLAASGELASLDALVATHYDEDHIGHLEDVMSYGLLEPTGTVYDRGTYHQTPTSFAYADYEYAVSLYTRVTVSPGDVIDLGGGATATVIVVNGVLPDSSSVDITGSHQFENAASIGLLIEYGDFDLWIGGDLTGNLTEYGVAEVEQAAAPFVGDVDVYTVNHHGSRTSSTAPFLAALSAEVAINQNSADNDFGHPNSIVVNGFLGTPDSCSQTPLFIQQNAGNPTDMRSDDGLASGVADPDDVDSVLGLAGTLLLVTDGTSYHVAGGNVAPIARHTDCTLSSAGNFPPAVLEVTRSPWVPLASETAVVDAVVSDEATPTVTLHWDVDGIAQTPLAMSSVGGNTYRATIPTQADGARVTYSVVATDSVNQSAQSRPFGYFSGVAPIAALRWNDADGILIPSEFAARIEAAVTVEPGIFHPYVSQVFAQDASGAGIQIFDRDLLAISRGDTVRFVGELEQFAGQTELNVSQEFGGYGATAVSSGTAPAAQVVTVSQIGEALEGELVRIDGVTVSSGSIPAAGAGNGYLDITDDGGVTVLTLKIDEDTDIPGAGTPTQSFDVVGVVAQFDAWPAIDSGYQIVPRERADLLSEEVNVPRVVIHEIHADPHGSQGDANGDGVVSSYHDEFVELVNTTFAGIDLSGWTLEDAVGVRHTFPAGTVVPAREAVVVFGGGSPTGSFGNAAANGLVFSASSGTLGLNNSGDTLTLRDGSGALVQTVSYGSEGGGDESLTRSPSYSNSPLALHATLSSARYSPGTFAEDGGAFTVPAGAVVLSEVLYDATGSDGGLEWVELVNTTGVAIDLSLRPLALGWGGSDYATGGVTLDSGILQPCTPFVVGGPNSTVDNASPTYDLAVYFSPNLQNSGTTADGVALFNLPYASTDASTVPIDAVLYGTSNDSCLLDETGAGCGTVDVADASSGQSVERTDLSGTWAVQASPSPGTIAFTCSGGGGGPGGGTCLDASTLAAGDLVISEVFYDAMGSDDGLEWVELYNASASSVCLGGLSLGWGGSDYTYGSVDLSGAVASGATWVIGGTVSNGSNADPSFDQGVDWNPDLQNSGSDADGVALFTVLSSSVTSGTVPYDAVLYGSSNGNCLLDETGAGCGAVDVGDASSGSSLERTSVAGAWQIQATPSPGATPLP